MSTMRGERGPNVNHLMQQCNLIDSIKQWFILGQPGLNRVTFGHYKESFPQNAVKYKKSSKSMLNAISSKPNVQSEIDLRLFSLSQLQMVFFSCE